MILEYPTIRLSVYIILYIFLQTFSWDIDYIVYMQAKFKILSFSAICMRPKLMPSLRKCHQTIVLHIPVRSANTFCFSRDIDYGP